MNDLEIAPVSDLLAGTPETAYFWGTVAGSATVSDDGIELTTSDERAAQILATIAGVADLEHETATRAYAHNTDSTRSEDEYTVSIRADDDGTLLGRSSALGFPVDGRGHYRFSAVSGYRQDLLRGLFEGCGTVCFKSSSGTVGISFVHDDRALLEAIQDLIDACPIDAPTGEISATSTGGYWFGVDDDAAPEFGQWVYDSCEESGLYAPIRRRKLIRSLEEATDYEVERDETEGTYESE